MFLLALSHTNLLRHALQEIIPAGAGVRNHALVRAVAGENDAVGPRAAAGVDLVAAQDGELVVGGIVGEIEAFVVVVHVRILVVADGLVLRVVVAALLDGVIDVGLIVARLAAIVHALSLAKWSGSDYELGLGRRTAESGLAMVDEPRARIRRD